jgi:hypothetical protein
LRDDEYGRIYNTAVAQFRKFAAYSESAEYRQCAEQSEGFMLRCQQAVVIFVSISIWSCAQVASSPSPKIVTPLRPLLEALDRAKVSASLGLSGHCDVGLPPHLPQLRAASTAAGHSPLQVAREMFADDRDMQVTQDSDGTIRMIESGAPTELLNVKISHISFESNGAPLQYAAFSPSNALHYVILQTPEVLAFAKAHDILMPFAGAEGSPGNQPTPVEAPHIAGSMDNLTVSQAVDRVLQTFPGIWVYENCPSDDRKGRVLFFWFFSVQNPGLFAE